MHEFRADLHIHTVLSPCASLEMSPGKIVQQAKKQNLQVIGITDHNSTKNCLVVKDIAESYGIYVLCGVEINTKEEVHSLAFFETPEGLRHFQVFMDSHLPVVENKDGKFGYQVVVDKNENILELEERLLVAALDIGINEVEEKVHSMGGIFIPAHIDKPTSSIYSQLAFLPPNLAVDALETNTFTKEKQAREHYRIHNNLTLVSNSDAHHLDDIGKGKTSFFMTKPHFSEIKMALNKKMGRYTEIK